MDAFYASVEQRDNPELKGKPIAVGGGSERGVTTTASYEARKYGVRSAMPGYKAKQLCPELIFVKPRFDIYKSVSQTIRKIFLQYTELIEPLSLDEAYLDVSNNKKGILYGMEVAAQIMAQVEEETQLTCSAGVSYCKFLAKVASGYDKPNGMTVIRPSQAEAFLEALPIKDFHGVGKVTARRMHKMGIVTGNDLKKLSKLELAQKFGKSGLHYYDIVRGLDSRPVNNNRVRKSIAVERTFGEDLETYEKIETVLEEIITKFFLRLQKADNYGRTITLKIKNAEFKVITRSQSKAYYIKDLKEIKEMAFALLSDNKSDITKVRLIGLSATNLEKENQGDKDLQMKIEW